jgi:2-dehydro-3-deoxyphosphooctonate aldolase (KDO 8-P synthase)
MGKMALALGVNGIFMEVHDEPDKALCDAPTQWPFNKLEWLLDFIGIQKKIIY